MKLQERLQTTTLVGFVSLLSLVACGTASSAKPIATDSNATPVIEAAKSPALSAAEDRVDAITNKRDNARKQLNAARANLRAAELELKAARADRDALAMRETAQNLANDSGFVSSNNYGANKQIASAPGSRLQANNNDLHQAPAKTQAQDFNAEPIGESPSNIP
jgi:chromosome segregation ATPase